MEIVFLTILNMSLTGAFVILAIWLARIPLRKAPKIISYCLWVVAGFRLVFPFSVEGLFSLIPFRAQPIPLDITHGVVADAPFPLPALSTVQSPQTMHHAEIHDLPNFSGFADFPDFTHSNVTGFSMVENLDGSNINSVISELPYIAVATNPLATLITVGAYVWLLGAAVMLFYGLVSYFLLKWRLKDCVPYAQNIFTTEGIKSPFVLGFISPRIYLPLALPESEREYIILHEQTHIRRHDHIVKFLAYIILCMHWFNPLVWAAFSLMSKDMEMSCDERVLKELGITIKKSYSMSLLALATEERFTGSPLAFGEFGIKERVKNVLNFKRHSKIFVGVVILLTVIFGAGFIFSRTEAVPADDSYEQAEQTEQTASAVPLGLIQTAPIYTFVRVSNERARTLGYFPEHDMSIVTFAENAQISLYLEDIPIDLQGRNIYPAHGRNFDFVYLPLEPLFDFLGLEYEWRVEWDWWANIRRHRLHILGTYSEIIITPNHANWSWSTSILFGVPNHMRGESDLHIVLTQKESGFYVHSTIFSRILAETQVINNHIGEIRYWPMQVWTPLIYHDMEKVILATRASIHYPHFSEKSHGTYFQFQRAAFPLAETVSVFISNCITGRNSTPRLSDKTIFETGQPFVESTRLFDYIMLPAIEVLEMFEVDFSVVDNQIFVPLDISESIWHERYRTSDMLGIYTGVSYNFPLEMERTQQRLHEVGTMMVDDVLFISHTDLTRILIQSFDNLGVTRVIGFQLVRRLSYLHIYMMPIALAHFETHPRQNAGIPQITDTENGRVALFDITWEGWSEPLPQGFMYRIVYELTMQAPHENLEVTLFVNGAHYEGTLERVETILGTRYIADFEVAAHEAVYALELLLHNPENLATGVNINMNLNIYPLDRLEESQ
ncbi:MAG: M56 family metallopeptidase [Defluviitaleaceae bacterium]|nr:M56 family metallopeptidase [Defluviitaleaceae bacterium]